MDLLNEIFKDYGIVWYHEEKNNQLKSSIIGSDEMLNLIPPQWWPSVSKYVLRGEGSGILISLPLDDIEERFRVPFTYTQFRFIRRELHFNPDFNTVKITSEHVILIDNQYNVRQTLPVELLPNLEDPNELKIPHHRVIEIYQHLTCNDLYPVFKPALSLCAEKTSNLISSLCNDLRSDRIDIMEKTVELEFRLPPSDHTLEQLRSHFKNVEIVDPLHIRISKYEEDYYRLWNRRRH